MVRLGRIFGNTTPHAGGTKQLRILASNHLACCIRDLALCIHSSPPHVTHHLKEKKTRIREMMGDFAELGLTR